MIERKRLTIKKIISSLAECSKDRFRLLHYLYTPIILFLGGKILLNFFIQKVDKSCLNFFIKLIQQILINGYPLQRKYILPLYEYWLTKQNENLIEKNFIKNELSRIAEHLRSEEATNQAIKDWKTLAKDKNTNFIYKLLAYSQIFGFYFIEKIPPFIKVNNYNAEWQIYGDIATDIEIDKYYTNWFNGKVSLEKIRKYKSLIKNLKNENIQLIAQKLTSNSIWERIKIYTSISGKYKISHSMIDLFIEWDKILNIDNNYYNHLKVKEICELVADKYPRYVRSNIPFLFDEFLDNLKPILFQLDKLTLLDFAKVDVPKLVNELVNSIMGKKYSSSWSELYLGDILWEIASKGYPIQRYLAGKMICRVPRGSMNWTLYFPIIMGSLAVDIKKIGLELCDWETGEIIKEKAIDLAEKQKGEVPENIDDIIKRLSCNDILERVLAYAEISGMSEEDILFETII